jgi:lambda repressor-like predicted transcriptional regulator
MLKGRKAQARYTELGCMVDMDPAERVASLKEKTLEVALKSKRGASRSELKNAFDLFRK